MPTHARSHRRGGNAVKRRLCVPVVVMALLGVSVSSAAAAAAAGSALTLNDGRLPAGGVLRVPVSEAFGGKTVIGQLTVDRALGAGFVTAYGCADGLPGDAVGNVTRSDVNFDGNVSPVSSNRLIVEADNNGDMCFYTSQSAALIVDVNAVTFDTGVSSFPNQRTDSRRPGGTGTVAAGGTLTVRVPEAIGGRTVVGQLTVDGAVGSGFVTAYGCAVGLPRDVTGTVTRSDVNFAGDVTPVSSNRLIVQADTNGDICFYASQPAALIVDINGVSDIGISSFANQRTDTRRTPGVGRVTAGGVLRVNVPQGFGGATIVGQLTVDQMVGAGFVTAYGCADGLPVDANGSVDRSDVNFDGRVTPVSSNRLVVQADNRGDICFYTSQAAALIVDVNGVSDIGITSFPNQRSDTRNPATLADTSGVPAAIDVPVWPPYDPLPALDGRAALTGLPVDATVAAQPILAVKIDNYGQARPQWGLEHADAVIEENVEGITRFVALFQSRLPDLVGPVRSARTQDLDLLAAMNRAVFAYSGANVGVAAWLASAASSDVLIDYSAQHAPCYARSPDRAGPHNLLLDPTCAIEAATSAGPARAMWNIGAPWTPSIGSGASADDSFAVAMDGVSVEWTWDGSTAGYLRSQDGEAHSTVAGAQIVANNVVEISTTYVPSPADARSPNAITVGGGEAIVHRNGVSIAATWSRGTPYDRFEFFEASTGLPIALNTGVTFLELTRSG
jgi:Protein of unknown function (DUF3048) N-terminal domain/Protein of unknown function (DUF3048) C-terminal domain